MTSDISDAATNVVALTNMVGATAAEVQQATQTARTARQAARLAARYPGRMAAVACGMLVTAGVLALRRERPAPPAT